MGTKLVVYVLIFDLFLALMVGAYSGITPPSIPSVPTYCSAQAVASSITWTVGWGKLTISTKAVKNGPTTGTEDSNDTLPVNMDSRYPRTDAIVVNIQIIQSKM